MYFYGYHFFGMEEVIDFYNDTKSIIPNGLYTDSILAKPLGLSASEKKDIMAFLLSLTDKRFDTANKILNTAVNGQQDFIGAY